MTARTLSIDILSYWHPGTGRGSGFHLDAVTHEGADGLPRLPGRTLKGLLRDALWRAEQWGWNEVPSGSTCLLFGPRGEEREETYPGALRVSDAALPTELAAYLSSADGVALVPGLYREHFSTSIDSATGVAQSHGLRGMRVVVPLELEARISEVAGVEAAADWRQRLQAVFPLITAVGSYRSRGFGRAQVRWGEG